MDRKEEILNRLESLPKGYLSRKTIHGSPRFYLQWREGSKIKSRYVPEKELPDLQSQLKERKRLEKELASLPTEKVSFLAPISRSASEFTGDVMEQNEKVASFDHGELTFLNEKKAPLVIIRSKRIEPWLQGRCIDTHRPNSRLLRKALRIHSEQEEEIVLRAHAACSTDDYWFRPKHSKLKYDDVSFFSDRYAKIALSGDFELAPERAELSPELTATGSYEKCWKNLGGTWTMVKTGSEAARFSEWFASKLAPLLRLPSAEYRLVGDKILTPNFASKVNLESLSALAGDDDSYENVFPILFSLRKDIAESYLRLCYFDCLVNNVDRHNENVGLLRSRETGEILSLAPNFDDNLCLLAVEGYPHDISRKKDGLISLFEEFLKENRDAASLFASLQIPLISKEEILGLLKASPIHVDEETLVAFLLNGQERLRKIQRGIK